MEYNGCGHKQLVSSGVLEVKDVTLHYSCITITPASESGASN